VTSSSAAIAAVELIKAAATAAATVNFFINASSQGSLERCAPQICQPQGYLLVRYPELAAFKSISLVQKNLCNRLQEFHTRTSLLSSWICPAWENPGKPGLFAGEFKWIGQAIRQNCA
jgi:hypothetical protein